MSEHEGGDSKVGSFLLGFLVGVLVCLGAGSVFFVMQARNSAMMAAEAQAVYQRLPAPFASKNPLSDALFRAALEKRRPGP